MTLRIRLLGAFKVEVDSREIQDTAWRRRKAAGLIKLLALAPGHQLHREQVLDLLWPDRGPAAAMNNLHRTLHAARHVLEPDLSGGTLPRYLALNGDLLSLDPNAPAWVDVTAFTSAAKSAQQSKELADYESALRLYTGHLLPEDRNEEWTVIQRDELRALYRSLLFEMAEIHERQGDVTSAITTLSQLVAEEPAHEAARVGLMRLYARSGQRDLALQHYRQLRDTLRRALDTEPEPATKWLYQTILTDQLTASAAIQLRAPPGRQPASAPRRHNLPHSRTRFVGRDEALAHVSQLLTNDADRHSDPPSWPRLVTLTGPGGSGKTRLALEVAAGLVPAYPDGVWLVDLAGVDEPALLPQVVASVLGVREQPGQTVLDTLANHCRTAQLLLLLDNCEHIVDACAHLAQTLLRACPQLDILATSRETLGIAREIGWQVLPLALPPPDEEFVPERLVESEAIRLFVDRARSYRPSFALTDSNAAAVAQICFRLDGLPLAIEIAAARTTFLTPQEIAARLQDCFRFAGRARRTVTSRHQTLRTCFDWSFSTLSLPEQTLFDRLSVFAGGWTVEAAQALCAKTLPERHTVQGAPAVDVADRPSPHLSNGWNVGIGSDEVQGLLSHLVEKSLIAVDTREGKTRYRLLEPLRQYGQERLAEHGETSEIRDRHASYFLDLAETVEREMVGPWEASGLDLLEQELANFRGALRWLIERGEAEASVRLAGALFNLWFVHGRFGEGLSWLSEALALGGPVTQAVRVKGLLAAGELARAQTDYPRAIAFDSEVLSTCRAAGDRRGMVAALNQLACVACDRDDLAEAERLLIESLSHSEGLGDLWRMGQTLHLLARVALRQGNHARAQSLFEQALDAMREAKHWRGIAICLSGFALVALQRGNWQQAEQLAAEGLILRRDLKDRRGGAECLEILAVAAAARGEARRATQLLGAANAVRQGSASPITASHRDDYERTIAAAQLALGPTAFDEAWSAGQSLTLEQAIEKALAVD